MTQVTIPPIVATQPAVTGYLSGENGPRQPAVILLHGCGGLWAKSGALVARETEWRDRFNAAGYAVLIIDSFTPRGVRSMCAAKDFSAKVYRGRAFDAYAALRYVQHQPWADPSHVAVMGWSNGGGTILNTIRSDSEASQSAGPGTNFATAIAFYPASCSTEKQGNTWHSPVALAVLAGSGDVWTPAAPCRALLATANNTEVRIYPDAVHDFDWPGMPIHTVAAFRTRDGVTPIEGEDPAAHADAVDYVMRRLKVAFGR